MANPSSLKIDLEIGISEKDAEIMLKLINMFCEDNGLAIRCREAKDGSWEYYFDKKIAPFETE